MLKSLTLALALLSSPALAMGAFPYVPSNWPAEGAFDKGCSGPLISSKGGQVGPAPQRR